MTALTTKPNEVKAGRPAVMLTPAVDVFEGETGSIVVLDVPGADREHADIHVEGGLLTVEAHRQDGAAVYKRTFVVPKTTDVAGIDAAYDCGVLTLTLPKLASAQPRQISIAS